MTLDEVHSELAQLGVSSDVHALVDDLELYPRVPPLAFFLMNKPREKVDVPKNVYSPHTVIKEVQGRLFEDCDRPLWQVFRMSRKKTKRICSIVSLGSGKGR